MSTSPAASAPGALVAARADAAHQAGVELEDVTLANIQAAQWDGCLGIRRPGQACTAIAVAGVIARFEVAGHDYRYHLVAGRILGPIDPALADDGSPPRRGMAPDTEAILTYYARADLALREGIGPADVVVEASRPGECGPGEPLPNISCAVAGAYHAAVRLVASGTRYFYAITSDGTTEQLAPLNIPASPDTATEAVQQRMRADLAQRLHVPLDHVSILSYQRVTWPDACLGIERAGQVCAQVVTQGFAATLLAVTGESEHTYTYHGANDSFVLAGSQP